jgi:hypothetical protein
MLLPLALMKILQAVSFDRASAFAAGAIRTLRSTNVVFGLGKAMPLA